MKINKLKVIVLVLCLVTPLVFVDFTFNSSSVSAQPETTIYIDPTPVTANVCENFSVALNIQGVTDLFAWQVKLSFDPDLLECLGATEGPFLMSVGPTIFPPPIIDNDAGTILAGCSLLMPPGASGSGTLAYIEFHCDGPGDCDLVFLYPDTFLQDSYTNLIPHSAVNGHVIQTEPFTRYLHKEEPLEPVNLHKEEPLQPVHLHPIGSFDPSNPLGSEWHELYPQYCNYYILTSWIDTDLSGNLTASDQIDFMNIETEEKIWYHLDRVTWTIFITETGPPPDFSPIPNPPLYAELEYPPKKTPPPIIDPVCTDWHVVYPPENYSKRFHIWSWYDNGDGFFGYCDHIDVEYTERPEEIFYYHVEEVAMDLILTKKCFYEPIGSQWHELYPEYCNGYNLTSWVDTNEDGKLSPSDQIDMTSLPSSEQWEIFWSMGDVNRDGYINQIDLDLITAAIGSYPGHSRWDPRCDLNKDLKVDMIDMHICSDNYGKNIWAHFEVEREREVWYHVDNVTLTIKLTEYAEPQILLYAEFMAPFSEYFVPIMNPLSTRWHVIYPPESFCRQFHIIDWVDNGDGVLSFCDQIDIEYLDEPEMIYVYHIEELSCDIKISRTGDIAVIDVKPIKTIVGAANTFPPSIPPPKYRINVTVTNQDMLPETFDLTLYAQTMPPGSPIGTITVNNLLSGETRNVTIAWDTSGWSKGNYTIWAYAWPVLGETHTDDNTFTDNWVFITIAGDVDGSRRVEMIDLWLIQKRFGAVPGQPNWDPNCDVDDSDRIEMVDMWITQKNFGEHW